ARLRADARGRDGGVREELAAGVVLRSGGSSAFGGKPEKHLLCLRFPVLTPVVGTRTDIPSPEQLVAVQIPLGPCPHPARCDPTTVRGFAPCGRRGDGGSSSPCSAAQPPRGRSRRARSSPRCR